MMFQVRIYQEGDAQALGELFYESVHSGATEAYNEEQREAWAPSRPEGLAWAERLSSAQTFVAEEDGAPVGFMTLQDSGYLDLAFVRSDRKGQGVAKALYEELHAYALRRSFEKLTTQASLLARPFFERQGWNVICEKQPLVRGVELTCFAMELELRS